MKTLTKLLAGIAVLSATATVSAFDKDHPVLTFSKSQGPYSELFIKGVQPILEKEGYTFKGVDMSDLLQADLALNDGEVDFNVEQHTAYIENFNKLQGGHLVGITPIPTVPAGMYPGEKHSLAELEDGDTIAIPNDAANTARAYKLLAKEGLIKMNKDSNPSLYTKNDIIENPRNLKFVEMKSLNIPGVATDFDFVVLTGSIVYNAKIDPKSALATEDVAEHLLLQLTVEDQNKDAVWAQDIKKAYQSEEFKEYLDKNNDGLWFVPKY
ncbi:MAG: MetQ/NlpA family ABC transporter substrate-binding protein [Succinivibrio sp.]